MDDAIDTTATDWRSHYVEAVFLTASISRFPSLLWYVLLHAWSSMRSEDFAIMPFSNPAPKRAIATKNLETASSFFQAMSPRDMHILQASEAFMWYWRRDFEVVYNAYATLLSLELEGFEAPIAFSFVALLESWWYFTQRILQSACHRNPYHTYIQ